MNCNPAGFMELHDGEDKWTFNSLAAKQANVWFRQFLSIVQEMTPVHFNFFLDEMLIVKNEHTVAVLACHRCHPCLVPMDKLKLSRN